MDCFLAKVRFDEDYDTRGTAGRHPEKWMINITSIIDGLG